MRLFVRSALIVGIAAFAVAGTALAGNLGRKAIMVKLPDGLTARVEYQGDVAPKITVEPDSPAVAAAWSGANWAPFIMLDRISADVDRQVDAMRQVRMLDAFPANDAALVSWTSDEAVPAGAARYSYVATLSGQSFCARSVEIIWQGPNQKPRITSTTSGRCSAAKGSAPTAKPAPAHST